MHKHSYSGVCLVALTVFHQRGAIDSKSVKYELNCMKRHAIALLNHALRRMSPAKLKPFGPLVFRWSM